MRRVLLCVCLLSLTWFLLVSQVWSYELAAPQDVRVDSELRWRPAAEPHHVTYTAQYRIFDGVWQNVPGCVQTELTTCNISAISAPPRRPCVMLRVLATEGSLRSRPVQAFSQDESCSPVFTLTPLPGSLIVHLWNNSLFYEYGDHSLYLINYSKNGHMQEQFPDVKFSKTIEDVEVGDRVCVEVQYSLYRKPYGPPSQQPCVLIPVSEKDRRNQIIVICVTVVVLAAVVVLSSMYIIIKKHEEIKQFLRPPLRLPDHFEEFLSQPFSRPPQTQTSQSEESYDRISLILPTDELSGV